MTNNINKKLNGTCMDCKRWYLNAPNYGLDVTEWICDRSHPADDTCDCYLEVEK